MSYQHQTPSGSVASPDAMVILPEVLNLLRNAVEQLDEAFADFRPLAILICGGESAASFVVRSLIDGIGGDVAIVRVSAANSNAIAGMREISRAIGFDPKHMSIGEMEKVFKMFLSYQKAHHRRTLICMDEAPDDAPWVLDRVQHFVRLETDGRYGMMVILSGRPGLNESLAGHALNALPADVAVRINTTTPERAEKTEYSRRLSEPVTRSEIGHVSERHSIPFLHRFSLGVPGAVRKLYARYRDVTRREKPAADSTEAATEAAGLPVAEPTTQLSNLPVAVTQAEETSPVVGRLVVHIDDEIIQTRLLKRGHILIGRSKMCDLRLIPIDVSRHHAMVVNSANGTELVDLRSTNGTFVDGRQIKRHVLQDNDSLSIGGCIIRYVADENR